ncbi:MAG TPA: Nudix family hydrolase, partial [Candidatus Competibacteraceae bacterium]|nr:Nudix family hydrolase [Candidatus Competibacteraceae bacterium]
RVDAWRGEPHGREDQPLAWRRPEVLDPAVFPAADVPIINALRLPAEYLIAPAPGGDRDGWLARLERAMQRGVRLVQLRAPGLAQAELLALYREAQALTRAHGARLLLNGTPEQAQAVSADGLHLSSMRLRALERRPALAGWLGASCHDAAELAHACRIGVDFAVLGPVLPTASHPGAPTLGWSGLQALTEQATLPVYALGGLRRTDLETAWRHGAQGIAAIRGLWDD